MVESHIEIEVHKAPQITEQRGNLATVISQNARQRYGAWSTIIIPATATVHSAFGAKITPPY
jgi:hypothetical protein